MIIALIILGILILITVAGCIAAGSKVMKYVDLFMLGGCISACVLFSVLFGMVSRDIVLAEKKKEIPEALDVYRGKTSLMVTLKDGLPVDSVVVFQE